MVWNPETSCGNESAKIKWELVPYTRGRGLDLGCGGAKAFPHFIGVDDMGHAQMFGQRYQPDLVADITDLSIFADESMDYVFSSHSLEHIKDAEAALKEWWRVLKVGGHMCLYLPHKDFYPNIGELGANPDHKHDFLPVDIINMMPSGFDLIENQERNEDNEYSFFQVYRKLPKQNKRRESWRDPKPEKTCAVVRYGAFGDALQAATVFPGLKDQGYHLTVYTVPRGHQVLQQDPYVDRFIIQDPEQVPNPDLGEFWAYLEKKYDKFVNLSESVEGTLLPIPGRSWYHWSKEARHEFCNHNYTETAAKMAGVPFWPANQRFYPSVEEQKWCAEQKAAGKILMLVMSGSSVHKVWPNMDEFIKRVIEETDFYVLMCGGETEKPLEAPWKDHPRVFARCGIWPIRQTLSMAQYCEVVVGPETGVMNAVAMESNRKVVTLSHSTVENLTKHWINTVSCVPRETPCYPCHRMHYNFEFCHQVDKPGSPTDGAALCQANISAENVWEACCDVLLKDEEKAA